MSRSTRRTFLLGLAPVPLLRAAKRETRVLVDLGSRELSDPVIDRIRGYGYEGFIQDAFDSGPKPIAIRADLPRFEDSMDDAAKELRKVAELAVHRGAEAVIATHPGLSGNGAFRGIDLERKARILDIAGGIYAARGLLFLYENQALEFTGNAAEERALISRTEPKTVSFLLDMGTAMKVGADAAEFFEANHKRIAAIRLAEGLEAMALAVKRAHWTGWIIAPGGRDDYVQKFRNWIRGSFGL